MRSKTFGLTCLCSAAVLTFSFTQAGQAQPSAPAAVAELDPSTLVGQDVRVTTITGAVWPGHLAEVTADGLTVQGSAGPYTISRAAVRTVEPLRPLPRLRPVMAVSQAALVEGGELRIHGSNTVGAQMVPNLLEAYGQATGRSKIQVTPGKSDEERMIGLGGGGKNRDINVDLQSHGTGTAFVSLVTKAADLGMASRPVNDKEREAVMAAGLGDLRSVGQEHVVGLDGLSVIVNRDNRVTTLSLTQMAAIFSGTVVDWSEVGGSPGRIQVYTLDMKSGTFDTFNELVMHRRPMAPGARNLESSTKLSDDVAADPNGIGFIGLAYVRSARAVAVAQGCGLTTPAEPFMVRTEEYPLSRRLFLYNPAEPTQPVVNFLNFASSTKAQPAIAAAGFVTLAPELSTTSYSELRKRNAPEMFATPGTVMDPKQSQPIVQGLRALFSESQRLSITFRFQPDSAALDTRGEADIERLVAWSKEPANASRQFVLVGYGSSIGSFAQNVALSRTRADALAQRLQATGLRSVTAIGAGPVGAVACNADAHGQALNRRVEVWVK